ncbi:MAG: hypothetical protein WAM39_14055 [Bryobacteraceae bacterium]
MRTRSVYEFSCLCGRPYAKEELCAFSCPCGRLLVLEWQTVAPPEARVQGAEQGKAALRQEEEASSTYDLSTQSMTA